MGSFSWLKADTLTSTANIVYGTPWKELHSEWRKAEKYLDQKSDFQINNH